MRSTLSPGSAVVVVVVVVVVVDVVVVSVGLAVTPEPVVVVPVAEVVVEVEVVVVDVVVVVVVVAANVPSNTAIPPIAGLSRRRILTNPILSWPLSQLVVTCSTTAENAPADSTASTALSFFTPLTNTSNSRSSGSSW